MSSQIFVVGVALAVAVLGGRLIARRVGVPDAAAYVLIGAAAGLLPGLPRFGLSPDVVLLVFLPPLVYYAAFFSDPRETIRNIGPIIGQSVGLVLVTAVAAAGTLLLIFPSVGWAGALAFGAAIAPPDPVAATSVLHRLGVPRRLVTVLESEGLINDGAALTLFGIALTNVGGTASAAQVLREVVMQVLGGIGFGFVVGIAVAWFRKRTHDPLSQAVWSLVTPYLAFVPVALAHASGVLATVTAAVWLGTRARGVVAPTARLQTETFWRVLNLLLVSFLFVLLGLQVPGIAVAIAEYPMRPLVTTVVAVILVVVVVRMAWAVTAPSVIIWLHRCLPRPSRSGGRWPRLVRPSEDELGALSHPERIALGWCGPRGAVSLAVALSLPLTKPDGSPFASRDLLVFLTVAVVLATLVGQVTPLPAVLRRLQLRPGEQERTEGLRARRVMVDAALREVEDLASADGDNPPALEPMRQMLELRRERLVREVDTPPPAEPYDEEQPTDHRGLQLRILGAERDALRTLSDRGEISRRTQLALSQELDLDETRLRRGR